MNENDVLKIFKNEKALLTGHFLLSSGLHSPNYMQCALVFQKPAVAEKICRELAKELKKAKLKIDVVVGPALGGMIVSYEMGRALGVRSIFAERVEGQFALRRGFRLKPGEKALIIEDVITTGKSSYEVIELVKREGGRIAAVASIVDRSGGVAIFQEDFISLIKLSIKSYRPEQCPLCRERKIPLTKPGSRGLKLSAAIVLSLFLAVPAFASDTNFNSDQARQDYRSYLQQLKRLGAQYREITGEMSKVLREEGVPTFDENTGAIGVGTLAGAASPGGVTQSDREMTVVLEMPGVKRDTIQVKIRDNRYLYVSGRRKAEPKDVLIEKTIELPAFASDKGPKAKYEDGILTVTIVKSGESGQEIAVPVR